MTNTLSDYYQKRKTRFQYKYDKLKRLSTRLAMARLISFLLLLVFLYTGLIATTWYFTLSFTFLVLFIFFIVKSEQIKERIQLYDKLIRLNQQEIDCQHYQFSSYDAGEEYIDPHHAYSSDLDIFGPQSFFQFINRSQTIWGRDQLAGKLTGFTTDVKEIIDNQAAIEELRPKIHLRQRFWAYAGFHRMYKKEYEQLKSFLALSLKVVHTNAFQILRQLMPVLITIMLVGAITKFIPWTGFILFFMLQYITTSLYFKSTTQAYARLEKQNRRISTVLGLFKIIQEQDFETSINKSHKGHLFSDDHNSVLELMQFRKIVNAFDLRSHWLMNIIMNGVLSWDLQCLHKLEKWRREYGPNIPGYLETLGTFDAAFCLANMTYNHPGNTYPTLSEDPILHTTEMGHPLIPPDKRIGNDIKINHQGQFIIITGANMAGKSTFLRTLGINHLLACNGLPVFASDCSFWPMPLFTSMRTQDSLGENESYFYAELKRLHQLVALIDEGQRPLILLDEILKGTNSQDKLKGSIAFLKQLMQHQCAGIIATHDLALTELEKDHAQQIVNKCFEIQIENGQMHFDYKLKDGVTKHMNALLLMKQMKIISE